MPDRRRGRRGSAPADPYEAAAGRLERARQARQEFGDAAPPAPGLDLAGPMRPRMRVILALFALALVFGVVQANRNSSPPKLAADCANSRLALSTASVRQGNPVRWTATGAAEGTVIVAVDVARFTKSAGGSFDVQPLAGRTVGQTLAGSGEQPLTGCRGTGLFAARLPAGRHTVSLFRLTDTGGEPVASAPLEVTERG
jgi:hypothetical protein